MPSHNLSKSCLILSYAVLPCLSSYSVRRVSVRGERWRVSFSWGWLNVWMVGWGIITSIPGINSWMVNERRQQPVERYWGTYIQLSLHSPDPTDTQPNRRQTDRRWNRWIRCFKFLIDTLQSKSVQSHPCPLYSVACTFLGCIWCPLELHILHLVNYLEDNNHWATEEQWRMDPVYVAMLSSEHAPSYFRLPVRKITQAGCHVPTRSTPNI